MNQAHFFDDLMLMYLHKKRSVSTDEIEEQFGGIWDGQNVNNVISNRNNQTSYIYKGLIKYDESNHVLKITSKGDNFIEKKYSERRG